MADFLSKPPLTEATTSGERAFYNRVKHCFIGESHIIGYFEPDIDGLHPDFLLLSPKYGIFIVEVKDYSEKYLTKIPKSGRWEWLKHGEPTSISNPFDQVYQYWRIIKLRIDQCHLPENLDVPIVRLVCFSQISEESRIGQELKRITPKKINLIFKESLGRNKKFKEYIIDLLPSDFSLSKKSFDLIRGNLIPTCRLPTKKQADLLKYFSPEDRVKLLDREQEKMARELGEGHRLIFGVAGSGKTILLIARARILAKRHPDWKILILCYNKFLRNQLMYLLNPQDYDANITINTFHSWARNYILSANNRFSSLYQEANTRAKKEDKNTEFFQDFVPKLFLQTLDSMGAKKVLYDAVLIDEAQDFEQDWFKCVMQVLNPKTNSLLVTCDGLQGIYARKKFTWISVGIQAVGRVKRFEKSYRTPIEIGALAQKALPDTLIELLDKFDEFISTKEYLGEHGNVEIMISQNSAEECKKLAEKVARMLKKPQEILVLFKYNMKKYDYDHLFFKYLNDLQIKWKELKDYNYDNTGLFIGTLHGTKGLESNTIIIPELNTYKSDDERQLLYVGITRSRNKLILSANKSNDFIESLRPFQTSETN